MNIYKVVTFEGNKKPFSLGIIAVGLCSHVALEKPTKVRSKVFVKTTTRVIV